MTYSIVARDPVTGMMGVAVQSHYFATGSVVTWAEAGVGVVATQSVPNVAYGPQGLDLMRAGSSASEALSKLVDTDEMAPLRQAAMVDASGDVAVHTGDGCIAEAGHAVGAQVSAQANIMERPTVWGAMIEAFEQSGKRELPDRLLAALEAAEREGGDLRGKQSAAMLVVSGERSDAPWEQKILDLRVDDHPDPLAELGRLLRVHRAFGRLSAVFSSGILFGPLDADAPELARALADLDETRRMIPDNPEPTFWQAVLLAKAGEPERARVKLREASRTNSGWGELMGRLVPAGILPDDPDLLAKLRS